MAVQNGLRYSWGLYCSRLGQALSGLVSTVDDDLAFAQMLLNQGVHKGKRILSQASIQAIVGRL